MRVSNGLPLICISGYAAVDSISLFAWELSMPFYLIAILLVLAAVAFFATRKKKQPAAPPVKHQGEFQGIFPSQYGGNTYEMTQSAGVVLFSTGGPSQGKEFPFAVDGVLSSAPQAQVSLSDQEVAAKLSQENGQYILRSTNGKTFSHNDKPTSEAKLASGDTLTFGAHVLKVQVN
jgi:hypothetical protein